MDRALEGTYYAIVSDAGPDNKRIPRLESRRLTLSDGTYQGGGQKGTLHRLEGNYFVAQIIPNQQEGYGYMLVYKPPAKSSSEEGGPSFVLVNLIDCDRSVAAELGIPYRPGPFNFGCVVDTRQELTALARRAMQTDFLRQSDPWLRLP